MIFSFHLHFKESTICTKRQIVKGSVEHPMIPEHYIEWIELLTPTDVLRHELKPSEKPEAIFMTDATEVTTREYCNLHGLWKGE